MYTFYIFNIRNSQSSQLQTFQINGMNEITDFPYKSKHPKRSDDHPIQDLSFVHKNISQTTISLYEQILLLISQNSFPLNFCFCAQQHHLAPNFSDERPSKFWRASSLQSAWARSNRQTLVCRLCKQITAAQSAASGTEHCNIRNLQERASICKQITAVRF